MTTLDAPPVLDGIRRALRALRPDDRLGPAEWAERYRMLTARVASEPGPYRLSRTPYLRAIHDALGTAGVQSVTVVAPAQNGKSEASRNWLGWIADQQPGPVLIVFPSEASAKENMDERVIPMFRDSPRLAELLTKRAWDVKRSTIALQSCSIYVGWAGSPQALASRPIRFVVLDEIDKYPAYRGKEADAVSLADVRTRSYAHRARVLKVSTPTIPSGPIMRSYEASADRRSYHAPCLACGELNPWEWEQVTWEGRENDDEDSLRAQQAALATGELAAGYRCPSCEHVAGDADRWLMVERSEWLREDGTGGPFGASVGFMIPGHVSPWTSFSKLAREYIDARLKGIAELHHFYNGTLGLPFWAGGAAGEEISEVDAADVWAKSSRGLERGVLPPWTAVLIASADPGKHEIPWAVRAWGAGYQSALIDCGVAKSLEELREVTLDRRFDFRGRELTPRLLVIDAGGGATNDGTRTEEVYRFAKSDPARIRPIKGLGGGGRSLAPVVTGTHTYHPPRANSSPMDVTRSVIDTGYFKDLLAGRINNEDRELWSVFRGVPADYVRQVCAEQKRLIERRVKPTGEVDEIMRWVPRVPGAANHFFDVESYNGVGAYMLDMDKVRSTPPPRYERKRDEHGREGGRFERRRAGSRDGGGWTIGRG